MQVLCAPRYAGTVNARSNNNKNDEQSLRPHCISSRMQAEPRHFTSHFPGSFPLT